jgi:hypothetical protein
MASLTKACEGVDRRMADSRRNRDDLDADLLDEAVEQRCGPRNLGGLAITA